MTIFQGIILGLIQGIAEFLPISSSGHLMLAMHLFETGEAAMMVMIILHIATLIAVLYVFRKKIWELMKKPLCKTNLCLALATLVTVVFVLLFKDFIDSAITVRALPITFIITAIILYSTTFLESGEKDVDYPRAAAVGLAQGLAVIPGFSRSGFTISAGLAAGIKREKAAEFSFLMSIPIIIASFVYEIMGGGLSAVSSIPLFPLIVSFLVALVSGVFAIKFMLHIICKVSLGWFSGYLVVLAVFCLFVVY